MEIKYWDVSQITDFSNLFAPEWESSSTGMGKSECLNFFNADISSWVVSKGTNFEEMFTSSRAFNADISKWVVSNGLNFDRMFEHAYAFNQDISGWRPTPNLRANRFDFMFYFAISFNQNLDDWNLEPSPVDGRTEATPLTDMFRNTYSLYHLPTWFSENEGNHLHAGGSCALDDTCGTCNQPRTQDFHILAGHLFPEVMQTVTCNAGQLNPFDGVDCKAQGCVDDNTVCCNPTCHTHEKASECLAGATVCWWNLDTGECVNNCNSNWKNDNLRQCSDMACGPSTKLIDGKCKPACISDGCVELREAYKAYQNLCE